MGYCNIVTPEDVKKLDDKCNALNKLIEAKKVAFGYLKQDTSLFAHFMFKNEKLQRFKPLPWQDKFLNCKNKRILVCCSRQIGKSTACAIKAIHTALFNPGYTILVISKTKPQADELVYRMRKFLNTSYFKAYFSYIKPKAKESKHEIIFKQTPMTHEKIESRIIVTPATEGSLGYSADMVICDEFARWENGDKTFLDVVEPTTFATEGDIVLLSTPARNKGLFYNFFNDSKYWEVFHFDWKANPKNTEEKMEIIRKQHTTMSFAMNYEAKFVSSETAYFTQQEIQNAINNESNQGWKGENNCVVGVDFGKVNDQSIIDIGCIINPEEQPNKQIVRLIDRRVKPLGTDYNIVMEELKAINKIMKPMMFVLDCTSGEIPADMLRTQGVPVEPYKFSLQSKIKLYNNLKILMQQKRIQIPYQKQLIDQIECFEYTISELAPDKIKLHAPTGMHDDECDSLALMAYGLTANNTFYNARWIQQGKQNNIKEKEENQEVIRKAIKKQNQFIQMIQKNTKKEQYAFS